MPSIPSLLHHFGTRLIQRGFVALDHLGQFGTNFVGIYGLFVAHCCLLLMLGSLIIIEEIIDIIAHQALLSKLELGF
jgi:hypothetical protein